MLWGLNEVVEVLIVDLVSLEGYSGRWRELPEKYVKLTRCPHRPPQSFFSPFVCMYDDSWVPTSFSIVLLS